MIKDGLYHMQENCSERGFKGKFKVENAKKGFSITMLQEPFFMLGASESAFKNHKDNKVSFINNKICKHSLRIHDDGTFTIYFYQSGIPCYFELIEKIKEFTKDNLEVESKNQLELF